MQRRFLATVLAVGLSGCTVSVYESTGSAQPAQATGGGEQTPATGATSGSGSAGQPAQNTGSTPVASNPGTSQPGTQPSTGTTQPGTTTPTTGTTKPGTGSTPATGGTPATGTVAGGGKIPVTVPATGTTKPGTGSTPATGNTPVTGGVAGGGKIPVTGTVAANGSGKSAAGNVPATGTVAGGGRIPGVGPKHDPQASHDPSVDKSAAAGDRPETYDPNEGKARAGNEGSKKGAASAVHPAPGRPTASKEDLAKAAHVVLPAKVLSTCLMYTHDVAPGDKLRLVVSEAGATDVLLDGKELTVLKRDEKAWVVQIPADSKSGKVSIKAGEKTVHCGRLNVK